MIASGAHLISFLGHGLSGGERGCVVDDTSIVRDATTVLQHVIDSHPDMPFFVMGCAPLVLFHILFTVLMFHYRESLGGLVAFHLALKLQTRVLVSNLFLFFASINLASSIP